MEIDFQTLVIYIKQWAQALGFDQVGITDIYLDQHEKYLLSWLEKGFHGQMHYMERHGIKRSRPNILVENTVSIISVRCNYLTSKTVHPKIILNNNNLAYISRYALGRDYHKVLRKNLAKLADKISEYIQPYQHQYRAFVDSAPVLEKALAEKAGLGWIGKNTNIINKKAGSWFFLGEIYTNLPLPIDKPASNHCGKCTACIDICPTKAIIAPYQLDARLCISYLTIEYKGIIPEHLRPLMGNRIYGCDDCQLICPWNKFAQFTTEVDFQPRHQLDAIALTELFTWSEKDFLQKMQGSAILRIGYEAWLRNIAIALGNACRCKKAQYVLQEKCHHSSTIVQIHSQWALKQQQAK